MTEHFKCGQCGARNDLPGNTLIVYCLRCGAQNWREPEDVPAKPSLLAEFDSALATITQRRGDAYGHPSVDFAQAAALKERLPHWEDRRFRHIAEMICVKLARLAHDPTHVDSLVDIAGYARTWVMILDKEQPK